MSNEKKIRVIASVPQIVFEQIELEMPEELYENGGDIAKAAYVWELLSSDEQNWCPEGLKGFESALDVGYSKIKRKVQI